MSWADSKSLVYSEKEAAHEKVEEIENQVQDLSPEELTAFREWFAKFDAENWDRQIEGDVKADKLERLAKQALRDHEAGRSTEL